LKGGNYLRVSMATNCRPPAAYIVDVSVSINIPSIRTFNSVKNDRVPFNGFESSYR